MIDIDVFMRAFCETGAQAIRRYYDVSGESPYTMPEYFMPGYILDHLGNQTTSTLETNFSLLTKWNGDIRRRRGLPLLDHDEGLLQVAGQVKGRRVDMVLYEGGEVGKPKGEQDFFALIDFKGGWLDADMLPGRISDRDKLFMLLAHIDTCPWGIVCGWAPENHRDWQHNLTRKTDDRWFEQPVELPNEVCKPLYFCARLFDTSAKTKRLKEIIDALPPLNLLS